MAGAGLTLEPATSTAGRHSPPPAATGPAHNARGRRVDLLLVPALLVCLTLFVAPLARLVTFSLGSTHGGRFGQYTALLSDQVFRGVLLRTVEISAVIALLCLVLGYPIAYAATRLPSRLSAVLLVCVALPFFTSVLVRTYAWQVLLSDRGPVNRLLVAVGITDHPVPLVFNNVSVIIGTTQILLPMMVFPLYSAMQRIDRSLQLAAQSMGASPVTAWRSVFLPLTTQAVSGGLSIVFISALGFYVTPILLQGPSTPLIAQRIDTLIKIPGQRGAVAAQSTVLLVFAVAALYLLRRHLGLALSSDGADGAASRRLARGRVRSSTAGAADVLLGTRLGSGLIVVLAAAERNLSRVRYLLLGLLVAAGLLVLLLPLPVIVMVAFTDSSFLVFPPPGYSTRWFESYFHDSAWLASTRLSLWVCLVAALAATLVGSLAAFAIVRSPRRRLSAASYLLMVAPMVMPQVILAVGLFYTLGPTHLLGRPPALVLAYAVLGLPLVVIILTAVFRNLDPLYERAAASLGASPLRVARTVVVPLVRPALASALLFTFITGFDDLVMAQFLGGFRASTLVRRMFENIRFEVSPQVAAVGTLLVAAIVVLALLGLAVNTRSRLSRRRALPALTDSTGRHPILGQPPG